MTSSRTVQRRGFGPMAPGVFHAPYANPYRCPIGEGDAARCTRACLAYIEQQILGHLVSPDEVAAVLVEPIQGEGGYVIPPPEFLQGLAAIAAQHGMLFIVDEVQSGIGRTGKMFAIEHAGVQPDIIIAAKGIASGLPMGVTIARDDVMDWPVGAHSNTFGGNPVACAAAMTTLKLVREGLMQNAAHVGEILRTSLERLADRHRLIGDVRGCGLMIGIELVRDRATKEHAGEQRDALVMAAFRRGLLLLAAGASTIRLSPPLVITEEQAHTAVSILDAALTEVSNS
jgi:4-aminobutyrate aminotransferase